MKAMVLAAGFGTRMRLLTARRTKPSIPFLNMPIISHILRFLAKNGVTGATINLHHHGETIEAVVGDGAAFGLEVAYSREEEILGTSGGLKKAEADFGSDTFCMVNGDIIPDLDLGEAIRFHREKGALATMLLKPQSDPARFSSVFMGDDSRIVSIAGRPAAADPARLPAFLFTGVHILEPEIFRHIPPGVFSDINRDVYPPLIRAGEPICGMRCPGRWFEVGSLGRYLETSFRALAEYGWDHLRSHPDLDGVFADPGAEVPRGACLAPPLCIGRDVKIEKGAVLTGPVVVGHGCVIEAGAEVTRSILWEGVRVKSGSRLFNAVVGDETLIPEGARFENMAVTRGDGPETLITESIGPA